MLPALIAGSAAEQLNIIHDELYLAPLLSGRLIIPLIDVCAASDVDRLSLGSILRDDFRRASERREVKKGYGLAFLSTLRGVVVIDGEAEIAHSLSAWEKLAFDVAGDVPDKGTGIK